MPLGHPPKKFTVPPLRTNQRQLPGFGMANGFDHDVAPAAAIQCAGPRQSASSDRGSSSRPRRLPAGMARSICCRRRAMAITRAPNARLGQPNKHQPNRPKPHHGDRIARPQPGFLQTAQHAGQRLDQSRVLVAKFRSGSRKYSCRRFALRNANVFGVSAVVEQQVFAKIVLPRGNKSIYRRAPNWRLPHAAQLGKR